MIITNCKLSVNTDGSTKCTGDWKTDGAMTLPGATIKGPTADGFDSSLQSDNAYVSLLYQSSNFYGLFSNTFVNYDTNQAGPE